jgi:Flp pilus assembly pilin Flp
VEAIFTRAFFTRFSQNKSAAASIEYSLIAITLATAILVGGKNLMSKFDLIANQGFSAQPEEDLVVYKGASNRLTQP